LCVQSLMEKCARDFVPTLAVECTVWPPFQALNFARVPLRHQLVVTNGGTIADSAFLCWYAGSAG
jgi:protein Mpv17